ncbi:MAG: ROK family protein [Clostridiales bacterium]|nr:ROK family protein [Clostridiales bacterium]
MYYIGVDLGGTNIAVGIVDENGKILRKGSVPTNAGRPGDEIVKDMASLSRKLLAEEGLTLDDIEYAGIVSPGAVDHDNGIVTRATNLKFEFYHIADRLKEFLGVKKVYVENDANAAALAEAVCGIAKGCKFMVMITLGTGVGGGIVLDKKVYSGFNYAGAELGHMVIQVDGRPCPCGRKGCWEAYSSATGLVNMTKEKLAETKDTIMWEMVDNNIENANPRTAFDAMRKGDKAAKEVVDVFIHYLAEGICNLINIFQPEMLVIGGGLSNEKNYLVDPINEVIDKMQFTSGYLEKTKIVIAELGNDAGIVGAAMLGKQ